MWGKKSCSGKIKADRDCRLHDTLSSRVVLTWKCIIAPGSEPPVKRTKNPSRACPSHRTCFSRLLVDDDSPTFCIGFQSHHLVASRLLRWKRKCFFGRIRLVAPSALNVTAKPKFFFLFFLFFRLFCFSSDFFSLSTQVSFIRLKSLSRLNFSLFINFPARTPQNGRRWTCCLLDSSLGKAFLKRNLHSSQGQQKWSSPNRSANCLKVFFVSCCASRLSIFNFPWESKQENPKKNFKFKSKWERLAGWVNYITNLV